MNILTGNEIKEVLTDIIYAPSQEHSNTFDLTVKEIHDFRNLGELDFGGSEYRKADLIPMEPVKRNKEDKYGWWLLENSQYLIEFNEQLPHPEKYIALLFPHERIINAGINLGTRVITQSNIRAMLTGMNLGVKIKENARLATLMLIKKD